MDDAHEDIDRLRTVRLLPCDASRYLNHKEIRSWLTETPSGDGDDQGAAVE